MRRLSSPPATRPDWLIQFGRRLLLARGRAGLTQQALGAPDLSKSFISLLESGRSHPSVETVIALAGRLQSSIGALLLDADPLRSETALNLLQLARALDASTQAKEIAALVDAAGTLVPNPPADLRLRAVLLRARAALGSGAVADAVRWADEAVALGRRHRLTHLHGMALAVRGEAEVRRGAWTAALPLLEGATEAMQRAKAARTEENIHALILLGTTRAHAGQVERAQRAYRRAADLATRLRLHALRGRALVGLGLLHRHRRRLDAAVEAFSAAQDSFEQARAPAGAGGALAQIGLIRGEQGRLRDALTSLDQALRLQEGASPRERSATLTEIAAVQLALGHAGHASRAARRAVKEAQRTRDQTREAAAQVALARALRALGRRADAIDLLRGAVAVLSKAGTLERVPGAASQLGTLLREADETTAAARRLPAAGPSRRPEATALGAVLDSLPR